MSWIENDHRIVKYAKSRQYVYGKTVRRDIGQDGTVGKMPGPRIFTKAAKLSMQAFQTDGHSPMGTAWSGHRGKWKTENRIRKGKRENE